jgi:hypothetical protein
MRGRFAKRQELTPSTAIASRHTEHCQRMRTEALHG